MKTTLIALSLLSFSAFAGFSEVECTGTVGNKEIYLEIEQPAVNGSNFQKANLSITENGALKEYSYKTVMARRSMIEKKVRYNAMAGVELNSMLALELEVDTWPDNAPVWGRNYQSKLRSDKVNDYAAVKIQCTFPNAL